MFIKELIQRVQSLYSKGVQSDDSRLSSRHIYNKLLSTRAKILTQKINKRQPISQWAYQTLPCVEMISALPSECPCLPPVGCKILKSKYPLPAPLVGHMNGHVLQSVTSIEGSIIFSETTWEKKKYAVGNKYTAKKPDFFIRNNYLYITTKTAPKVIAVTGLFNDPLEAAKYPSICGTTDCKDTTIITESKYEEQTGYKPEDNCPECLSPLDLELPLDNETVETVIEIAVIELVDRFVPNVEDTSNNSTDTPKEQSK